jgi:cell wall-associated NlpC family hydrolase
MARLPTVLATSSIVLAALAAGCASHGPAVPQPFPVPGGGPTARGTPSISEPAPVEGAAADIPSSMVMEGIISTALHLVGTRYRNGGADPEGFDCSGFVQYVFAQQGVLVPRTVEEQARYGMRVDELRPGDLVFFHTTGHGATHVGIALDNTRFVHAPSSRGEVRVEPLARPYWAERFIEARRMLTAPAATSPY